MPKFIALSGPSCIGKTPLYKALKRFYPELIKTMKKIVRFNDRSPRPGEQDGIDYHFRSTKEIEALREEEGYLVIQVRSDLNAIRLQDIHDILGEGCDVFFEGNPKIFSALVSGGHLAGIETISAFLSPLSREEILFLKQPEKHVHLPSFTADIMRRKLLRRTQKQKGILSQPDLENIEIRCTSAYEEMKCAPNFDYVIPNHDGEDSDNWDAFYYPIGEARKTIEAFVSLLNNTPGNVEHWEEDLI